MTYNFDSANNQLSDLIRQYQQLQNLQQNMPQTQSMNIPQIQVPIPVHQVQYVEGAAGAMKYQLERLQPNSSEVIMDKDVNVFYIVSKDANGTPSKQIPAARFEPIETISDEPAYLTRKDFDDFKEEIRQLLKSNQSQEVSISAPVGRNPKVTKEN